MTELERELLEENRCLNNRLYELTKIIEDLARQNNELAQQNEKLMRRHKELIQRYVETPIQ